MNPDWAIYRLQDSSGPKFQLGNRKRHLREVDVSVGSPATRGVGWLPGWAGRGRENLRWAPPTIECRQSRAPRTRKHRSRNEAGRKSRALSVGRPPGSPRDASWASRGGARPTDVKTSFLGGAMLRRVPATGSPPLGRPAVASPASSLEPHHPQRSVRSSPAPRGSRGGGSESGRKTSGLEQLSATCLPRRAWVAKSGVGPPLRGDDGDREPAQAGRT